MIDLIVLAALFLVFCAAAVRLGPTPTAVCLFLGITLIAPKAFFTWELEDNFGYSVGIAAGEGPSLFTHGIFPLAAVLVLILAGKWRVLDSQSIVAILFIAFGVAFLWPATLPVLGGSVYLVTAVCAWVFGRYVAPQIQHTKQVARLVTASLAAAFVMQLAILIFQLVTGDVDGQGRPWGSLGHPAVLGKDAVILSLLLLPLTRSADKLVRGLAWVAVVAGTAATALTVSRANIAAIAVVLVAWVLFLPSSRAAIRTKIILPLVMCALLLPLVPTVLARFEDDPEGGDRPALLEAGLRMISDRFWTGTGPNNFVHTASATEAIVQETGYPVHNAILLLLAELGIVGCVIFVAFLVVPVWKALRFAWRNRGTNSFQADTARAVIAMTFGLVAIGFTGWGLLGSSHLFLLFFVLGFARGVLSPRRAGDAIGSAGPGDSSKLLRSSALGPKF